MTTDTRNAAIREAKRYVLEIIRNDWTFEPSTDSGLPARCSPRDPDHEVVEWRLREYDSSGSELEPQTSPAIASPTTGREPTAYDDSSSQPSSPVFPASGGRAERRRKRRRQMEEEMSWNEGLRTWVERRDAWSGARTRRDHPRGESAAAVSTVEGGSGADAEAMTTTPRVEYGSQDTFSGSTSSRPLSRSGESSNLAAKADTCLNIAEQDAQSLPDREAEDRSVDLENKPKASTETAITEPDPTQKLTGSTPGTVTGATPAPAPATAAATAMASSVHHKPGESEDPLIPVVSSLIPSTNPIRASINPAMYPSIYSKVVIQGLTPTVPINLADVTKAMVQGWKSDGQWPPKPATTNIVLADDATVPRVDDAAVDKPPSSPESKRRSGVASAVRKVFNFSGFHTHPFHRRGSSHSSNQNQEHPDGQVEGGSSVVAGSANAVHPERR
ncbi:hypothetical protein BDV59DRAFT_178576 [Aspergillus ambiguus]|uniref:DUF4050 domain-containing protein n=1 Tax=Aspergillus ambiguus TaxID=176160 RepID=UPI003CCDBC53